MEKRDGDVGEAAKSLECVAAGALSHGLARLRGAVSWSCRGVVASGLRVVDGVL